MGDDFQPVDQPHPTEMLAFNAWRLFLRSHLILATRLDIALRAQADLPLAWYDVLTHVSEAPQQHIKLRDLEDRVLFSQSTMSRLVSKIEARGYLERSIPPDDRRTVEIHLTSSGARQFRTARAIAIKVLRENFVALLTPGDAERLLEIHGRLSTGPTTN